MNQIEMLKIKVKKVSKAINLRKELVAKYDTESYMKNHSCVTNGTCGYGFRNTSCKK